MISHCDRKGHKGCEQVVRCVVGVVEGLGRGALKGTESIRLTGNNCFKLSLKGIPKINVCLQNNYDQLCSK